MPELDSVLPAWFVLDAATIQTESRIRGDQQAALGGEAEMLAEIGRRIPDMGAFVIGRLQNKALENALIADFQDDLSTLLTLRQKREAMASGRMLVIAALHGVLPSDKNQNAAKTLLDGRGEAVIGLARLGSALSFLESLERQLDTLAGRRRGQTGGAQAIHVERAPDEHRAEYDGCWRPTDEDRRWL